MALFNRAVSWDTCGAFAVEMAERSVGLGDRLVAPAKGDTPVGADLCVCPRWALKMPQGAHAGAPLPGMRVAGQITSECPDKERAGTGFAAEETESPQPLGERGRPA
jgi:hypothetical protein